MRAAAGSEARRDPPPGVRTEDGGDGGSDGRPREGPEWPRIRRGRQAGTEASGAHRAR